MHGIIQSVRCFTLQNDSLSDTIKGQRLLVKVIKASGLRDYGLYL